MAKKKTKLHNNNNRAEVSISLQQKTSTQPSNPAFGKNVFSSLLVLWLSTLFICAVYCYTAFPSVPGGDSGELLAEACQGGTAHPPGYPLYTALVNGLYKLTHQELKAIGPNFEVSASQEYATFAWKVNIFSCFLGAGAALLSSMAAELWMRVNLGDGLPWIAAMGGALFAFSPLTWEYSVGAEVFSLNNFLVAWLLYQTVKVHVYQGKVHDIVLAAFICGLAISNQHTSALFQAVIIPAVAFAAYQGGNFSVSTVLLSGCFFLVGLSPYVYLIVASAEPKPGSWGEMQSFTSLIRHILRQEYGTLKLGVGRETSEGMWERINVYLCDASEQTFYMLTTLGCLGMVYCLIGPSLKTRSLSLFLVATSVFYQLFWNGVLANLPLDAPMPRAVQSRFWMQPNLLLSIFSSFGAGALVMRSPLQRIKGLLGPAAYAAAAGLLLWGNRGRALGAGGGGGGWRGAWHMHRYGEAVLADLPEGSLLIAHTDLDWNTVRYLRTCEGLRPDITHLSFQLMPFPWFKRQARLYPNVTFPPRFEGISTNKFSHGNSVLVYKMLDFNIDKFPAVFIDMQAVNEAEIEVGGLWTGGFHLVPSGNLYRVYRALDNGLQAGKWVDQIDTDLEQFKTKTSIPDVGQFPAGSWEFAALSVYWDAHYQAGLFYLTWALALSHKLDENALPPYAMALSRASDLLVSTLRAYDTHSALTSSYSDLIKNTVLCVVRLQGTLEVVDQFRETLAFPPGAQGRLQDPAAAKAVAVELVRRFVREVPGDKDVQVFRDYLSKIEAKDRAENGEDDSSQGEEKGQTSAKVTNGQAKGKKKKKNKTKATAKDKVIEVETLERHGGREL